MEENKILEKELENMVNQTKAKFNKVVALKKQIKEKEDELNELKMCDESYYELWFFHINKMLHKKTIKHIKKELEKRFDIEFEKNI